MVLGTDFTRVFQLISNEIGIDKQHSCLPCGYWKVLNYLYVTGVGQIVVLVRKSAELAQSKDVHALKEIAGLSHKN